MFTAHKAKTHFYTLFKQYCRKAEGQREREYGILIM